MKVISLILILNGVVKLGGVRFSNRLALALEKSARVSRPWLRGSRTSCNCGGLGIEKYPLGGSAFGLAVESVTKGRRQMSEYKKRAKVL